MTNNYEEFEDAFMHATFGVIGDIRNSIQLFMDEIKEKYKKLSNEYKKGINIDEAHFFNIGITVGNKMGEISSKFKNKNISFYCGSALKELITVRLFSYCGEAAEQLRDLSEVLNSHNLSPIQIKLANELFANYQKLNNKIFNFDLASNLVECFDDFYKVEKDSLENIKNELNTLGLGHLYGEIEQNINNGSNKIAKK